MYVRAMDESLEIAMTSKVCIRQCTHGCMYVHQGIHSVENMYALRARHVSAVCKSIYVRTSRDSRPSRMWEEA
jgi:hypothetical protein